MDLHPSREMVASGQRAGRNRKTQAHIRIWSTETLQTLYVFGMGEFEVGVAAVAFSHLVSVMFYEIWAALNGKYVDNCYARNTFFYDVNTRVDFFVLYHSDRSRIRSW